MAEKRVTVDKMSDAIMAGLKEYADLATDTVKEAVKDSAKTVKKEIQEKRLKGQGVIGKAGHPRRLRKTAIP